MATARYVNDGDGVSCSVILGKASKTSKVRTSLLGLIKLLIVLKAICSAKSSWIQGISIIIID